MTEALDMDHLVQPGRVHRRLYTDADIFAEEMVKVFGGTWSFLAHTSEIPEPGDFRQVRVGLRPVLVTRGDDGAVHALLNRCTHRGATLVEDEHGCAQRHTCPYHGWTFANDGRLVAVPYPGSYGSGFDKRALGLGRLRVDEYRGFVFGTLDPSAPPLVDYLGAAQSWFDIHIDRNPGARLVVLPFPIRQWFRGNWKLSWDNAADGLHATFAHASYNRLGEAEATETILARDPARTDMFAKDLGGGHMLVDQRPGMPDGAWATMRPMPFGDVLEKSLVDKVGPNESRHALELATGSMVNLSLFPNLILVGNQMMVVEPYEVDRTRLSMYMLVAPHAHEEINLYRLRVEEDFTNFGTPDDLEMFERVQRGLAIPEMEWIDVSRGLDAGCDEVDPADGLMTGPITSEAPMRGYLREYKRLMTRDVTLRAR